MATLYHLNKATGKVAPCKASKKSCPLGGQSGTENHYATREEAQEAYEAAMEDRGQTFSRHEKPRKTKSKQRKTMALTLTTVALVSLGTSGCKSNIGLNNPTVHHSTSAKSHRGEAHPQGSTSSSGDKSPTASGEFTYPSASAYSQVPTISVDQAEAALQKLPVKGAGPKTGYSREFFIPKSKWGRVETNVLKADMTDEAFSGSKLVSGKLQDAYSGSELTYQVGKSKNIDVDHMVSLGDAYVSGAEYWGQDDTRRQALASDPLNLQAVSSHYNRQKGDSNAASWLPPNNAYKCVYVERQVMVKTKYSLSLQPAEKNAMVMVLAHC